MTATNGIRTENKIKRLAAAVALAVTAMLGASCLSPARADAAGTSDGNLVIDVPTTVPCALMADGTVVSPSEWKITTSGDAYIASASASGFPANVEWSAKTTDLAAAQAGSVQVSGTGDAASVTGPSDPASAKLAPSAGFKWAFSKLDAGKNSDIIAKAAGGTAVLGSVTFTFAKIEPDAFAVYSADDGSLTFYKRANMPVAGQTFEGKTATEVYTGIETMTSIPGWTQNHFNDIKTVTVCDEGIAPTGTAFWFAGVRNLKTADVSKLDMSRCKTIECMFTDCISLETLDLSGWDTSSLTNMSQAFHHCASLTKLNVSGWDVSKVTNMQLAFAEDKALGSLDLSTWDNSTTTSMKDAFLQMDSLNEISLGSKFKFVGSNGYLPTPSSTYIAGADGKWYDTDGNGYVPADIPSNKAMTYTAVAPKKTFAVYSADDDSLNLYKRAAVPAAGEQFEGKAATEVYEGVEDASYTMADGAPWGGHAAELASVTVADEGVGPVSTAYWFKGASKLKSVSLAGLDTSQTTCMDGMFDGCSSLETLDLSNMSTRRVASMTAFLGGCDSLAELSLGSEFAWVDDDCYPPTGDWKQESTGTKYAENQIPANKTDKYTRAKTAFAVYSADDQSLTFYKRFEAASEGAQFLGKTATKVFTGFETKAYFSARSVPWSAYKSDVKTVTVADEGIAPRSTEMWFSDMAALGSADMLKLDTSNVVRMGFMFDSCGSLTSLDVSHFDTHNVMRMDGMFYGCESLTSLDLSSFETGKVVNMDGMFINCRSLTTLDLSSFDTGKVTSMYGMFDSCGSLTSLDVSHFDTRNVTTMVSMFSNCKALPTLDLSSFDTHNVTTMEIMFSGCKALTSLNVSSFDTSNVTNMRDMFNGCTALTNVDLSSFDTGKVTDMSSMFMGCKALTTLDFSSFDTRNVTNMRNMFWRCTALTTLDLSTFDTSSVTSMSGMFSGCSALQKAAFGAGWKWAGTDGYLPTPSSTYIAGADGKWYDTDGNGYVPADIPSNKAMTYTAVAPKKTFAVYSADDDSLNLYKRAAVPAAGEQFEGKAATEVYEGVEDASYTMADGAPWGGHAAELASVTVADEGVGPVSTAYWFKGASKLKSVSLAGLDTSQTTCMDGMFDGCSSLETLDLSNMSTRRVASMTAFLGGCDSLAELSIGSEFAWVDDDCYPPTGDWKQGSTGTDYSESDIPANKTDKYTRTKTAFAVYSADDNSLTFYKRFEMPAEGAQFLGKTATGVYTGFETQAYDNHSSNVPWLPYRSNIKTVTVADAGVAPVSTANWFGRMTALESADISKLDTRKLTTIRGMFDKCSALTTLNLSSFDTSAVVDMGFVFENCSALTSLDLSSFNTGNVADMSYLFYGCTALTSLDLSSFNTGNVTTMREIFMNCKSLTSLNLSSFDTGKVRDFYHMFGNCGSLTSLDLSSFDTHSAVDMSYLFANCGSLTTLDLSSFDTRSVTQISHMFDGCKSLTSLDLSSFDTSKVSQMYGTFQGCSALTSLNLSSFDTRSVENMSYLFAGCESLTSLDLSSFDTHNVEVMDGLFIACKALTSLNLSSFDTSNVMGMHGIFNGCSALSALDLSSFDTGNVTDMDYLFRNCSALQKVAFGADWKWVGTNGYLPTPSSAYIAGADGKWYDADGNGYAPADIPSNKAMTYTAVAPKKAFAVYSSDDQSLNFYKRSSVPTAGDAFEGKTATSVYAGIENDGFTPTWTTEHGSELESVTVVDEGIAPKSTASWFKNASKLSSVSLDGLDTANVTNMASMFSGCSALPTLDLSSFDTGNVTGMYGMFQGCKSLTSLNLTSFDTKNATNMGGMFNGCSALTSLNLSSFSTGSVENTSGMFRSCSALTSLDLSSFDTGNVTGMYGMFEGCSALTSLDVSSFSTGSVTNMGSMFQGCKSLTSLDVSSFKTGSVTNMYSMFYDCKSLTSLNLSSFDTAKVSDMSSMFCNCEALTSLNLTSFDTGSVEYMSYMFSGCGSLTTLNLSSFKTGSVKYMNSMFKNCGSLTALNLSSFDTGKVTDMSSMFYFCSKLSLDCSNWNVSEVTNHSFFNRNAPGVTVPLAWRASGDEDGEDSAVAPFSEEQGNRNALSVPSKSDNDAGNSTKPFAGSLDATQNDAEGKPPLVEKTSKESGVTTEPEGAEKDAEGKPAIENEATKEDVSAIVPEGAEKATAVKSGE